MSHGKLKCCGSPSFLKHAYHCGYNLSIMLDVEGKGVGNAPKLASDLTSYVCQRVPGARLFNQVGAEVLYLLPFAASPAFEKLFNDLEGDKGQLQVRSYTVTVSNLEQVFLKVASDEYHTNVWDLNDKSKQVTTVNKKSTNKTRSKGLL